MNASQYFEIMLYHITVFCFCFWIFGYVPCSYKKIFKIFSQVIVILEMVTISIIFLTGETEIRSIDANSDTSRSFEYVLSDKIQTKDDDGTYYCTAVHKNSTLSMNSSTLEITVQGTDNLFFCYYYY